MSCSWDLRCLSCEVWAGFDENHGQEMLAVAWEHREAIAALVPLSNSDALTEFRIGYSGDGGWYFINFCAAHKDHDVRTVDEYGRVSPRAVP